MPADDLTTSLAQLVRTNLIRVYGGADGASGGEVLTALLTDGWIREEWGGRYHDPTGDVDTWRDTRKEAEAMIAARAKGGWRFRSSLIRRFVLVTGPEEVPDA